MIFCKLILILTIQWLAGFGLLQYCKPIITKTQTFVLSFLLGMYLSTISIYINSVFFIDLTFFIFLIILLIITILCNLQIKNRLVVFTDLFKNIDLFPKLYFLPFWAFLGYLLFVSMWRAYYLPVTPYDAINGIDLIAKFAVKEGSIFNSIFDKSVVVGLSTQSYYAPFTSFNQIIYRLIGFSFGQFWLALITFSFVSFLFSKITEWSHGIFAGIICILIFLMPEFYAYTFLLQTDYSNAVFFCISICYFYEYWTKDEQDKLYISAIFMMIACWTRSETIFFVPLGSIAIFLKAFKNQSFKALIPAVFYCLIAAISILLWNIIVFKFYFNDAPSFQNELRTLSEIKSINIFNIMKDINDTIILNQDMWSYTLIIFITILVVNIITCKDKSSLIIIFWIAVLYTLYIIMLVLFKNVNIQFTIRRGYFKILFLMFLIHY